MVIDADGNPAGSALTFPSVPRAIAAAGLYVLVACQEGVHVFDSASAAIVQSLPYPNDLRPSRSQKLLSAVNSLGTCVLVSGYHQVPETFWIFIGMVLAL